MSLTYFNQRLFVNVRLDCSPSISNHRWLAAEHLDRDEDGSKLRSCVDNTLAAD